ncbi:sugar kinase [Tropicimonas sp. TH_r6]|uniref:carbohydrate kinase family protein n=1 Tax=Tropicimonas sp. TH_r6 TaxID=3082085 RepID=UPI002954E766|nr:sugar kinase [Tropicimonas sp. TH_r6]MDV7145348.1 sugar kinase [Tropicimonas sp. TH_r6]
MPSGPTILSSGELLVEFVSHRKGCGLETISEFSGPYPSGAPAIFIDQAARMGATTGFFGTVGKDGFGRTLVGRLKDDGVDISGIATDPDKTTGTAFVSYYEDGSRTFIFHLKGTAAEEITFSPDALPAGDLILHVSAASLGAPKLRTVILQAVEAVLARGGRISCDPNARPELMRDDEARQALEQIVDQSWCLMPSTSDLGFLFPGLDEDAAVEKMLSAKAEIIALKRGGDGATVISGDQRHDFRAHKVEELDPTGAGDGFCGTFVGLLAQGVPLVEAGRRANAAGAIAVTRRGPMEGNSTPEEIDAFLARGEA